MSLRCCTAYDTRGMVLSNGERSLLQHQCNIKRKRCYQVVVFRVTVNRQEIYFSQKSSGDGKDLSQMHVCMTQAGMNHHTVGGCYTDCGAGQDVFHGGRVMCTFGRPSADFYLFQYFFVFRHCTMCRLFLKNSNLRIGNVFFGGISTIMQITAHFGVKKCRRS